jgi:hypothetical protein
MFSMSKFLNYMLRYNGFGQYYKCQDYLIFIELAFLTIQIRYFGGTFFENEVIIIIIY